MIDKYEDDLNKLKFGAVGTDDGAYYLFDKDPKKLYSHFTALVLNRHDFMTFMDN